MVDIDGLRALDAVARLGSVHAAADELCITPSAVSQRLRRLDDWLGEAVTERLGRGLVVTERGHHVIDEARRLFVQLEQFGARVGGGSHLVRGAFRLVGFSTAMRGMLAAATHQVAVKFPQLEMSLVERDPAEAVAMVAAGQAELAVAHSWVGVPLHIPAACSSEVIGVDMADAIVHRGHRLAHRRSIQAADLLDDIWASTGQGTICHDWFTVMYSRTPYRPTVRYWAWEFATQIELVRAGLAVALIPRLGRGTLPKEVVALPVKQPQPLREVLAVWRTTTGESNAVQAVLGEVRQMGNAALLQGRKP